LGIGGGRATSPHRGPAEQRPWSLLDSGSPWSAGCDESRTSGAEGGPGKRAGSNPGTAPRSDPYIIGANNKSAIGTLVERSTRFVMLLHLPDGHSAEQVRSAMTRKITELPEHLAKSITWDQGAEMSQHARFTVETGVPVYFCDPRSPWQRGTNENTNGLLRQYFPKGIALDGFDEVYLDVVADKLNRRPRMTLDWDSPAERLGKLVVATAA
ncbi:MAG: IS30 family transposase, partial [Rhodococcus sp. (in: high G+C Gram-positive bacteria)]